MRRCSFTLKAKGMNMESRPRNPYPRHRACLATSRFPYQQDGDERAFFVNLQDLLQQHSGENPRMLSICGTPQERSAATQPTKADKYQAGLNRGLTERGVFAFGCQFVVSLHRQTGNHTVTRIRHPTPC